MTDHTSSSARDTLKNVRGHEAVDARSQRRNDIQGLRAIAVVMVVAFHAFALALPGGFIGVDIFFVISGFIITSQLLRTLENTQTINLRDFYSRRIRRLLPASVLVLIVTLIAAWLLLPQILLQDVGRDGVATSLYVANYWFASSGTDYWADDTASLFQHYWSLAVEEQFYLIWPFLLLLAGKRPDGRRRRIIITLSIVTVLSLAACVAVTAISQPWAFFSLPTRAWELALGGLVAVLALRPRAVIAQVMACAGLVGIGASALLITEAVAFPGWIALIPVLSTAAVIAAGPETFVGQALAWRPLTYIGDRSYSIYLWHWPVLMIPAIAFGHQPPLTILALLVLTFLLSIVSFRYVESSFRHAAPPRRAVPKRLPRVAMAAVAATLTAVLASCATVNHGVIDLSSQAAAPEPTSAVVVPEFVPSNLTPTFDAAPDDKPVTTADGCHLGSLDVVSPECIYGEHGDGPKVVLFGDSHATHWFPAFEDQTRQHDGQLLVLAKSGCPSVNVTVYNQSTDRLYTECDAWRATAIERIHAYQPDIVVIANWGAGYPDLYRGTGDFVDGWRSGLQSTIDLIGDGPDVAVLEDTPHWDESPIVCMTENMDDLTPCAVPVGDVTSADIIRIESEVAPTYVPTLDLVCTDTCHGLNGSILLYRDKNHLTATAARHLGPEVWVRLMDGAA